MTTRSPDWWAGWREAIEWACKVECIHCLQLGLAVESNEYGGYWHRDDHGVILCRANRIRARAQFDETMRHG